MSKHADSIRIVSTHYPVPAHLSDKIRRDFTDVMTRFQTKHGGATIEIISTNGHGVICKVDMLDQEGKPHHVEAREKKVSAALDATISEMSRQLSSVQAQVPRGSAHRPPYVNKGYGRGRNASSHA
jgi:hypothetical protein